MAASGLVGRGGAAFPTGRKWARGRRSSRSQPHYLVCNADESEPGTFSNRVLMEGDPFAVVESIAIAAFAVGASKAFVYIRGEYPLAEARLLARDRRDPRRRASSATSTSSSGAAPAPTSAARRRRSSSRSRASAASPATSRRSRSRSGCSASRRRSTTSRRSSTCSTIVGDGRRGGGVQGDRHRGLDRPEALLRLRQRRAAGRLRGRVRRDPAASCSSSPAASPAAARSRRCCSVARPASSSGRTRSTCR